MTPRCQNHHLSEINRRLKDELIAHYWPELKPFEPFGDPLENKRETLKRDEEQARRQAAGEGARGRGWWGR